MEIEFPGERHSAINALMGSILNNNYCPANNAQYRQQAISNKQ
ncbi:conserved hypothetical protein [Vibrio crassostreae]|nr:conserved hypothetical protein [Vibrio crassostreae]CAK2046754.1 conserved hypothetical protein [Vibrio crassostreae]CAK2068937.1 conserved hypothetical protein [Vibrio crassostreae]CAK2929046.1 conserved hypothetical protein [Vibrio crassostreae]CAK2938427.1 conserved hypothetical protein [Vibrio crassostreae]